MWKEPNDQGDETVVLDFDGTDPQSDRSINFALSHEMLKMFVVFYLITVFVSFHGALVVFLIKQSTGPGHNCE